MLDLVEQLHRDLNRTVVMVLHDLNLAARYADHLVVMKEGRIVVEGAPAEILDAALLLDVFGLRAEVVRNPVADGILVIPIGTTS